jgi:hypothetical protein
MRQGPLKRIADWASLNWLSLAVYGFLTLVGGYLLYAFVLYPLLFASKDVKRAEGTAVVAKEQTRAEETITTETLNTMREREEHNDDVATKVTRGRGNIDAAAAKPRLAGQTNNDAELHAAGVDALCELHNGFCGDAGSETVQ